MSETTVTQGALQATVTTELHDDFATTVVTLPTGESVLTASKHLHAVAGALYIGRQRIQIPAMSFRTELDAKNMVATLVEIACAANGATA
jgi:predicted 2-oxoglutarate/Fe(II)-dependent dioxygenase YbiX